MKTMVGRPLRRFFYWPVLIALIGLWGAGTTLADTTPAKTLVQDTLYRGDGSVAQGTILISWPAFTSADGGAVAAGSMSVKISAGGAVSVSLVPNTGSTPASSYKVTLRSSDGVTSEEYWTVPAVATTTIGAIRSKLAPVAVAQQFIGRDYVDTKVDAATAGMARTDSANAWTGAQTFASFNQTLNASQYTAGSSTCGIAESYARGPSTGVFVILGADCTIPTAQTITTSLQKPLYLNGEGRVITCTNTGGICLTLIKPDSTPRTSVVISDLRIVYSGSSASVTGLKIGSQASPATDVTLNRVEISNFNTSGATALELDNAEEVHAYSTKLNGNTLALKLDKYTNNNQFFGTNIQGGSQAVSMTDASGNNFIGGLIQSNTGTRLITETSSTLVIQGNTFENVWIENNGDGTVNARQFYLSANNSHSILGFASLHNTFNAGANGASGKVYEFAGDASAATVSPVLKGNNYGGWTGSSVITGTLVFPTIVESEAFTFADVGFNLGGVTGLHFFPQTGSHHYQMYAGDSVNMGGTNNLFIKDLTAGVTALTYTAATQVWSAANFSASAQINAAGYQVGGVALAATHLSNGTTGSGAVVLATNATLTTPTFSGTANGSISGNAATATALAANGSNCATNQFAQGVDARGNAEGCAQPSAANLSNGVTGSGAVVLASGAAISSATLTTPNIGVATGTSLDLGKVTLSSSGTVTKYNNITTAGTGLGPIYGSVSLTAQGAAISATNLYTATAGLYRVCYDVQVTRAASSSSSVGVTIGWNNGGTQTKSSTAVASNALNAEDGNCYVVNSGGSNITYATSYSSSGGTSMQYALRVTAEQLQ